MSRGACWSRIGRGARALAAIAMLIGVSGCSSNFSRFDFPSFNLTGSTEADETTTAAIPVPQESVYASGSGSSGRTGVARSSLPPPAHTPRVTPASYPATQPPPKPSMAQRANATPRAQPAVMRAPAPPAPAGRTVTVEKGDNLSSLSRRYGVSVAAIKSANNLSGTHLSIGQKLMIPGAGYAPPPEKTYTVEKGDTPHLIAKKFNVDEKGLIARNDIRPDRLQIGQTLVIPASNKAAPVQAAKRKPSASSNVRVVRTMPIPAPGGQDSAAASPEVVGEGRPPKKEGGGLASNEQLPSPDPMSGNSFRWPVQGRIISPFGTRGDGGHNDGINFAVPQGTSVKAAENGVVAYAGSELKAYGNLVLVRHANNWVSAYAHNNEILVKRGDKVRRGQIIAKAGMSGSVSQPQVHFELRKGSRPVNPTKYMSRTTANAN